MPRLLFWYPIALTTIGVGIHLFGTLGLFQLHVLRVVHVVMLIVDLLVVIGLLKKTKWGYWLAILLYIEQSIGQPYWSYQGFGHDGALFQLLVVCPLVIAALAVLVFNKRLFVKADLR
jgi:hypothetical protein